MIVYRFCSKAERDAVMSGKTIVNDTRHYVIRGDASSSFGFCFFTEDPEEAKHWLSGIVVMDFLMAYEVDEQHLTPSLARYAQYSAPGVPSGCVMRREWCSRDISPDKFRLLSVSDRFAGYAPRITLEMAMHLVTFL